MIGKEWLIALLGAAFLLAGGRPASCGPITFDFSYLEAEAFDAAENMQDSAYQFPTGVPFNATSEVVFGETRNTTVYDFSTIVNQTDFVFSFDHVRGPSPGSFVFNYQDLEFTAPNDFQYEVTGFYGMTGDQQINLHVGLVDITDSPSIALFENIQTSYDTPNESFTVGLSEGDIVTLLDGSPTGTLTAGRTYFFFAQMSIEDDFLVGSHATAEGEVRLTLTQDVPAVPEPSSLALLGTGCLGLIGYGSRRRLTRQAA